MTTEATQATSHQSRITPKRLYGFFATAEMFTWALLISGMIAKYAFDFDALMFPFGLTHGAVFVSYAVTAGVVGLNQRWKLSLIVGAVALAIVPFATLPFDRWLAKRGKLQGAWRTEKTEDPRDNTFIDNALRFGLRHPIATLLVLALSVTAVVTVLLQLGPPTEWFN
ncbi:MAG: DUF3817 domain-containing protein [Agrococcus casei]|nr:DUF3817 domain-containing protein [Agrococcus casei]